MKKIINFFKEMWNHKEISDEEYRTYFEYKKFNPGKEIHLPLTGRSLMILIGILGFIVLLFTIFVL